MRRKIEISYNLLDNEGESPKQEHVEELEEKALERIFEMIEEGYYEGELNVFINTEHVNDDQYYGWWKRKTERDDN